MPLAETRSHAAGERHLVSVDRATLLWGDVRRGGTPLARRSFVWASQAAVASLTLGSDGPVSVDQRPQLPEGSDPHLVVGVLDRRALRDGPEDVLPEPHPGGKEEHLVFRGPEMIR
jgi:hypothetical protein